MGARAICTARIRLRHHNHSLNAGTVLDKTSLTGRRTTLTCSARGCCPEPPRAARLHVLQLPASKLGQGCLISATFCAVLLVLFNLFIVEKFYYLFPDAKLNWKNWVNFILLKFWLQQEDFCLKIFLTTIGWTPDIHDMCIQYQKSKLISKHLFLTLLLSIPRQCD